MFSWFNTSPQNNYVLYTYSRVHTLFDTSFELRHCQCLCHNEFRLQMTYISFALTCQHNLKMKRQYLGFEWVLIRNDIRLYIFWFISKQNWDTYSQSMLRSSVALTLGKDSLRQELAKQQRLASFLFILCFVVFKFI